jgi:hypothetical protein
MLLEPLLCVLKRLGSIPSGQDGSAMDELARLRMVRNPAMEQILHVRRVKGESERNGESALDVGNGLPSAVEVGPLMAIAENLPLGARLRRGMGQVAVVAPEGMAWMGKGPDEGTQVTKRVRIRLHWRENFNRDLGIASGIHHQGGIAKGLIHRGAGDVEPKRVSLLGMRVGEIPEHEAVGQGEQPGGIRPFLEIPGLEEVDFAGG